MVVWVPPTIHKKLVCHLVGSNEIVVVLVGTKSGHLLVRQPPGMFILEYLFIISIKVS